MSTITTGTRRIILLSSDLKAWVNEFMLDRRARGLSQGTLKFYRTKLRLFLEYCNQKRVQRIDQLIASFIRDFVLNLEEEGYNPGGRHECYRTLRAFLRWWENEVEPDNWRNPILKVHSPKQQTKPMNPIEIVTIKQMIVTCDQETILGSRDAAILVFLLDTGVRASELCSIKLADLGRMMRSVVIRCGKGVKSRTTFLGKRTRRFLRKYLNLRNDDCTAFCVTRVNCQLRYESVRDMLKRRAKEANVPIPSTHDFRRVLPLNPCATGSTSIHFKNHRSIPTYSCSVIISHKRMKIFNMHTEEQAQSIIADFEHSPVDNLL